MKAVSSKVTKPITLGTRLLCHDNSGARIVEVVGVVGYKGVRGRYPSAGVGDIVVVAVKKGNPDMVKKVVKAVIIRQKKEFRRPNGMHISFEDNAAVLVNDEGLPSGTEIKGVVAREVAERYPKVAAIAPGVI